MESLSPSSDNPTPKLECMACERMFEYPWHLKQHLSSRKHTGENSNSNRGRNCCPICRKVFKARGLASHMKVAHQYVAEKDAPAEQPKNLSQTNPSQVRKLLKVKINEHERAFMKERVLIEERKIADNSKRVRHKRELHDYVASKQEFVASLQQQEKEAKESAQAYNEIEEEKERYINRGVEDTGHDHTRPQEELHDAPPPQPSASLMIHSREVEGFLPGLRGVEEERQSELSRCSTSSTSSKNLVREALQELMILTVATLSSLYLQEEKTIHEDKQSRVEKEETPTVNLRQIFQT
ncbi:unnamed protein product [Orchesella dallaii]|uniref:C2H2-type domain-containing protein n=1 Tax=Orchesella dallaii TaxID=48710 RepID=A0ABP1RCN3_9HEXA